MFENYKTKDHRPFNPKVSYQLNEGIQTINPCVGGSGVRYNNRTLIYFAKNWGEIEQRTSNPLVSSFALLTQKLNIFWSLLHPVKGAYSYAMSIGL